MEKVEIGQHTLYKGDCREILPTLGKVDAIITDPPYSERLHAKHDKEDAARDGSLRSPLGYAALNGNDVAELASLFIAVCDGWIVWMTDSDLALIIRSELEGAGRCSFSPLPFYQAGRSVRLSGDGPCSWTDWIVVARTKAQAKWGTLPGGYIASPGWSDKARMGGKPTALMERLVSDYSRAGDLVLDSHMGAGTTGVACIRTGRRFIGCEIEQEAFDLACQRIDQANAQGCIFDQGFPGMNAEQMGFAA